MGRWSSDGFLDQTARVRTGSRALKGWTHCLLVESGISVAAFAEAEEPEECREYEEAADTAYDTTDYCSDIYRYISRVPNHIR